VVVMLQDGPTLAETPAAALVASAGRDASEAMRAPNIQTGPVKRIPSHFPNVQNAQVRTPCGRRSASPERNRTLGGTQYAGGLT